MPHFFYPVAEFLFLQRIQPTLARCRREKSFRPGHDLFAELQPRIIAFHASFRGLAQKSLVEQAAEGLSFDPATWRAVVGEVLLFAADELPLLDISPRSLCCLLGGGPSAIDPDCPRERFTPIQQVLFGSHDVVFAGHYYRPDFVGLNDLADVVRLAEYLRQANPDTWRPEDLLPLHDLPDNEERAEELEFIRQGWSDLVELYVGAKRKRQIVICENSW